MFKTRKPGTIHCNDAETDVFYLLGQQTELGILLLLLPPDDLLQVFDLPGELLPLSLPLPRLLAEESLVGPDLLLQTLHPQLEVLGPPGGLLCNDERILVNELGQIALH